MINILIAPTKKLNLLRYKNTLKMNFKNQSSIYFKQTKLSWFCFISLNRFLSLVCLEKFKKINKALAFN